MFKVKPYTYGLGCNFFCHEIELANGSTLNFKPETFNSVNNPFLFP